MALGCPLTGREHLLGQVGHELVVVALEGLCQLAKLCLKVHARMISALPDYFGINIGSQLVNSSEVSMRK